MKVTTIPKRENTGIQFNQHNRRHHHQGKHYSEREKPHWRDGKFYSDTNEMYIPCDQLDCGLYKPGVVKVFCFMCVHHCGDKLNIKQWAKDRHPVFTVKE